MQICTVPAKCPGSFHEPNCGRTYDIHCMRPSTPPGRHLRGRFSPAPHPASPGRGAGVVAKLKQVRGFPSQELSFARYKPAYPLPLWQAVQHGAVGLQIRRRHRIQYQYHIQVAFWGGFLPGRSFPEDPKTRFRFPNWACAASMYCASHVFMEICISYHAPVCMSKRRKAPSLPGVFFVSYWGSPGSIVSYHSLDQAHKLG